MYLAGQVNGKAMYLQTLDLAIRGIRGWLPLSTCDAILYSSPWDRHLGIATPSGVVPVVQVHGLHQIAQLSDDFTGLVM